MRQKRSNSQEILWRKSRDTLYVYNDYGTSSTCVQMLTDCLREFAPEFKVKQIDGRELLSREWCKNAALMSFGGGFDKGYMKTIGEEGCRIIRDYVSEGGNYLGICAGAYFASGRCVFDKGGPLEVNERRYIRAFPGEAIGPAYPGFQYGTEKGCNASPLLADTMVQRPEFTMTYFNGGCYFDVKNYHPTDVLFKYEDLNKPAIIMSRLGDGRAVLSGAHFEFDPTKMDKWAHDPYLAKIMPNLLEFDDDRQRLCRYLISHVLLVNML